MQHQAFQDRDWEFSVYVQDPDGNRVDITGSAWTLRLFDAPGGTPVLTLTSPGIISVTDPGGGRMDVAVPAASMNIAVGNYTAELVRTDTGADVYGVWEVVVSLEGSFINVTAAVS